MFAIHACILFFFWAIVYEATVGCGLLTGEWYAHSVHEYVRACVCDGVRVRACVRACVLQGYSCRVRQYSECMVRASDNETDPSCIREHHTLAHTHRYTALSTSLVVTTCVVLLSPAIDMMQFSNTDRFGPEYFAAG